MRLTSQLLPRNRGGGTQCIIEVDKFELYRAKGSDEQTDRGGAHEQEQHAPRA